MPKRKLGDGPKYYAVRVGHKPGIYIRYEDCQEQVTGFKGSSFKAFTSRNEAELFVAGKPVPSKTTEDRFYAVAVGRVPGIYETWESAQEQIVGVKGPKYKKFGTRQEAEDFIGQAGAKPATQIKASIASSPTFEPLDVESDDSDEPLPAPKKVKKEASAETPPSKDGWQIVYTDGSSLGNGKKGAQAGVGVFFGEDDPRNVSESLKGSPQTNQRAELTAVLRALQICDQSVKMRIITDSNYSINCATVWCKSWKRNGWKTSKGEEVMNKDLVVGIRALLEKREARRTPTEFQWIKGHSNDAGNNAADQLAVSGARSSLR